jgi:hypothetical protein
VLNSNILTRFYENEALTTNSKVSAGRDLQEPNIESITIEFMIDYRNTVVRHGRCDLSCVNLHRARVEHASKRMNYGGPGNSFGKALTSFCGIVDDKKLGYMHSGKTRDGMSQMDRLS